MEISLHKTISIHALREEGDDRGRVHHVRSQISIHALREEGDEDNIGNDFMCSIFLSTPSARRATRGADAAPRLGGDFYPRPPRGGRHFYNYWQ